MDRINHPNSTYTALEYLNYDNKNWTEFVKSIVDKRINYNLPYERNTYFVLDRIHNREIRKAVIEKLIGIDFNPLNEPFPLELFADYVQVVKSVENLQKEYDYCSFYLDKGETFISFDGLSGICVNCDPKLSTFAFRLGYDLFFQMTNNKECIISLNAALLPKSISLYNIFNKLNRMEKDTWVLWDQHIVLKTQEGKTTNLELDTLLTYLKEFTLH